MLIALPLVITVAIMKFVSIETPEIDNRRTLYCVAENRRENREHVVVAKTPCQQGSVKVDTSKPGLAERKSK